MYKAFCTSFVKCCTPFSVIITKMNILIFSFVMSYYFGHSSKTVDLVDLACNSMIQFFQIISTIVYFWNPVSLAIIHLVDCWGIFSHFFCFIWKPINLRCQSVKLTRQPLTITRISVSQTEIAQLKTALVVGVVKTLHVKMHVVQI